MSTAADQTTISYPTPPELIGEPAAVVEHPEVDPYTRDVMADRHRAGDSVDDLADDYGVTPEQVEAAIEQAPRPRTAREVWASLEPTDEECRAPRRRHRWEEEARGEAGSLVASYVRCRRCGLTGRKVLTRTGGSLRLETLDDGATEWSTELHPCPGDTDWQIPDDVAPEASRVSELEQQVEELESQVDGQLHEIEIRGELLDRVKAATGETWWYGAVERVERDYSRPERDQPRAEQAPARERSVPPTERRSTTKRFDVAGTHGYPGQGPDVGSLGVPDGGGEESTVSSDGS
jgi:hypothetical protein